MKRFIIGFSCVLVVVMSSSAWAKNPISAGLDIKVGTSFDDSTYFLEQSATFEKASDVLKGVTFGFENLVSYADPVFSGEMTFSISYGIGDNITIGVAPKMYLASSLTFAVDTTIGFSFDIAKMGLSLSDDNSFLYNFDAKQLDYANTLGIEKTFKINETVSFGLGLENELTVVDGDIADGISVGPKLVYGSLTFYFNYLLGIVPDVTHGAEFGIALEI